MHTSGSVKLFFKTFKQEPPLNGGANEYSLIMSKTKVSMGPYTHKSGSVNQFFKTIKQEPPLSGGAHEY